MAMKIEYKGWGQWGDWGSANRRWVFGKDVEELSAKEGDELLDRGPAHGIRRFSHRRKEDGKTKHLGILNPDKVKDELFWGVIPAWHPPREGEKAIEAALKSVAASLDSIAASIQVASTAGERLELIGRIAKGGAAPEKTDPATENRFLRLKGEHQYDNGDPYTDFELLVDVPEIPVTRANGENPMHAAKGDVLRERYEDELTPFELKRNGKRIGDPEWWQIRHLFVGINGHEPDDDDDTGPSYVCPDLRRLYRMAPGATSFSSVMLATAEIPGTVVRAGDFLAYKSYGKLGDLELHGAVSRRVPRAEFEGLEKHFDEALAVLHVSFHSKYSSASEQLGEMRTYMRRRQNPKWKDSTSPFMLIRPLVAPVTEPIAASTDDAAIFELLHQVGGRMPHA